MKEWILSVGATIIITTIFSIIVPEGKIGDYIKGIFSILVIFVIINPLFTMVDVDYNLEDVFNSNGIVLQEDFLEFTNDKKIQNITSNCEKIIKDIGIDNATVYIDYFVGKNNVIIVNTATINLIDSVIISNEKHIDIIEDMKTLICEYLNIDYNKVIIYE